MIKTPCGSISINKNQGSKPLVVLLHGIQGSKELFTSLLASEALRRREVLVPDFPGWGDSKPSPECIFSIDEFANLVELLVQSQGQSEAIIIGHSLGGMVGTRLLCSRVLKIKGLVSLEGNLKLEDCGASREIAAQTEEDFVSRNLPRLIEDLTKSSSPSAGYRLQSLKRVMPSALYRISQSIVEECSRGRLYQEFVQSSVPRLLLVGEKSNFATREVNAGSEVVVAPNSSHFLLHDNFEFVKTCLAGFLDKITNHRDKREL